MVLQQLTEAEAAGCAMKIRSGTQAGVERRREKRGGGCTVGEWDSKAQRERLLPVTFHTLCAVLLVRYFPSLDRCGVTSQHHRTETRSVEKLNVFSVTIFKK